MTFSNYVRIGVSHINKPLESSLLYLTKSQFQNEKNYALLTGKVNNIISIELQYNEPTFRGKEWFEKRLGTIDRLNTLVTTTPGEDYRIFFRYNNSLDQSFTNQHLNIRITSNHDYCYQGTGFKTIHNRKIRLLYKNEIEHLLKLKN